MPPKLENVARTGCALKHCMTCDANLGWILEHCKINQYALAISMGLLAMLLKGKQGLTIAIVFNPPYQFRIAIEKKALPKARSFGFAAGVAAGWGTAAGPTATARPCTTARPRGSATVLDGQTERSR
uniref:DUF3487 family protein n=1 Tax=Steinernema glaseri TaxID=37863 RepID=A0A1I7ZWY1_9BILA